MHTAVEVLSVGQAAEIVAIALIIIRLWLRHRDGTHAWLAAAFGILGLVSLAGQVLPTHPHGFWQGLAVRVLICAIVLYPYLLYRFALTFHGARRRWLLVVNTAGTAVVCLWSLALPHIPAAGERRTTGFAVFVVAVLLQWTALSALVAVRLWRSARNEPTVARRRMRTLAVAAIALDATLLVSGTANSTSASAIDLVLGIVGLLILPLFYVGLAPPNIVLTQWRSRDQQEIRLATVGLLKALSPKEICDGFLPRMTNFLGGHGAAIIDLGGNVIGSYMLDEAELTRLRALKLDDLVIGELRFHGDLLWLPMSTGSLVILTSNFMPFFGQDELRALLSVGTLTDLALSRVHLIERDRANVESMRDFVAIASHDLRTPTASISGYAALLERRWDVLSEADKLHAVEAMNRQSIHLNRLVEDLLTTSRIGAAAIPVQPTMLNLATSIAAVVHELQLTGVEVVVPPDLSVLMDRDHFRRIITNYVRNAEVYGAPPLRIEALRDGDQIAVKVIDSGAGVPEAFRPRLFEKFARADSKMSSSAGGTGLGLSIVSGLVEAAGGTAWYAPNHPTGSIFAISLPIPIDIPHQSSREPQWTSAESSSSSKTRSTFAG